MIVLYFFHKFKINVGSEEKKLGNSFLRLALESVMVWADKYAEEERIGNGTRFNSIYKQLIDAGVKFPSEINYYKRYFENKEANRITRIGKSDYI